MANFISELTIDFKDNSTYVAFCQAAANEGLGEKKCEDFHWANGQNEMYLTWDGECEDEETSLSLSCNSAKLPTAQDFALLRKKIRIFAKDKDLKVAGIRLADCGNGIGDEEPQLYFFVFPLPKNYYLIPKNDEEKANGMKKYFYRVGYSTKDLAKADDFSDETQEAIQEELYEALEYDWSSGEKLSTILPLELVTYDEEGNEIDSCPFPCELYEPEECDDGENEDDDALIDEEDEVQEYDLSELEQFPKSQELHKPGNGASNMVCSCGSKKFKYKVCLVGGCNEKGFKRVEKFQYGYVCQKCGAEVYLGIASDDEAYFYFVSKDKQAAARSIVAKQEIPFGKNFFIAPRWDDILPMADFSDTYNYMKTVLASPTSIEFEYSDGLLETAAVNKMFAEFSDDLFRTCFDDPEDAADVKPLAKVAVKPNKIYSDGFGLCASFALDENGELVLNDDAGFAPDEQDTPYEGSAYERFYNAMKVFREISASEKIVFLPEEADDIMMDSETAKFIDSIAASDFKYYAIAAVINPGKLGTKFVISQNSITFVPPSMTGMFGFGKNKDNCHKIIFKNIIYKPGKEQGDFPEALSFKTEDVEPGGAFSLLGPLVKSKYKLISFEYKNEGEVQEESLVVENDIAAKLSKALNLLLTSFWQARHLLKDK